MNVNLKYEIQAPFKENFLRARGIQEIERFLLPQSTELAEPETLGEDKCKLAAEWIEELNGCSALIVVDSDCDGYCASAILIQYLKQIYPNWEIDWYVHEGKQHGLEDVVLELDLSEYELVFLPDAGVSDDEYFLDYPSTRFIVLDHHERSVEGNGPENAILIDNQIADTYVNKALSGAGVTWQFCRYLDKIHNTNYADDYQDLAAVAIIGDLMDLTTLENRYIVSTGIHKLKNTFLKLLRDNAAFKLGDTLTPIGIAFYMVPMINGMCRTGSIAEKQRMFLSLHKPTEMVECHKRGVAKGTLIEVAVESVRECTNAKARQTKLQTQIADLCEKQIIEEDLEQNKIMIITLDETFDGIPPEMNGVTATKLANDYGHPILMGRVNNDGYLRGSIRGLATIDMPPLKEFLLSSGMFEWVQGHGNAAGFSILQNKVPVFTAWANDQLKEIDLNTKTWHVDFKCTGRDSNLKAIIASMDELSSCWGTGIPEAQIYVHDINFSISDITVMGKSADTVKIMCNGVAYMFFKLSQDQIRELKQYPRAKMRVVGTANLNVYYNRITPQIFVSDYEIENDAFGF